MKTLNVQALRETLKLSRAQLAELAGVNVSTVWRWEEHGIPDKGSARALLERLADEAATSKGQSARNSSGKAA